MGIPRFYRWLSERYPQVNQKLTTELTASGNTARNLSHWLTDSEVGKRIVQLQTSSASSFPVDCLYLDLNGILHATAYVAGAGGRMNALDNVDEIWVHIMKYIDDIVQLVKPTTLLFIAVDGVAPRAKLNQQRARRFRTARDRAEVNHFAKTSKISADVFAKPANSFIDNLNFDSNCITPGTEFMHDLMKHLTFFVANQVSKSGTWKQLDVILSGPDVPGEGEHKIMEFIRY